MQPYELSASEAARQIKSKELSPVSLVQSLLDRIDSLEPALKAWVYLDREEVLSEARRKEQEVDSGTAGGPLHGVPIGLKDIYYTAGIPTTACSKLYADFVPEYDATTVSSLKQAGAIMLGKTVTTEFACMDPSPAINPWNSCSTLSLQWLSRWPTPGRRLPSCPCMCRWKKSTALSWRRPRILVMARWRASCASPCRSRCRV